MDSQTIFKFRLFVQLRLLRSRQIFPSLKSMNLKKGNHVNKFRTVRREFRFGDGYQVPCQETWAQVLPHTE